MYLRRFSDQILAQFHEGSRNLEDAVLSSGQGDVKQAVVYPWSFVKNAVNTSM